MPGEDELRILSSDDGNALQVAILGATERHESGYFTPIDKLDAIVTLRTVERELERKLRNLTDEDELHSCALEIWGECIPPGLPRTTRRKIFACLVIVGRVPGILDFIKQGIYDCHLPLDYHSETRNLGNPVVYPTNQFGALLGPIEFVDKRDMSWRIQVISFVRDQGALLAPFFPMSCAPNEPSKVYHLQLSNKAVLPFLDIEDAPGQLTFGGFSIVRKVKIHPAHHNCRCSVCTLYKWPIEKITADMSHTEEGHREPRILFCGQDASEIFQRRPRLRGLGFEAVQRQRPRAPDQTLGHV